MRTIVASLILFLLTVGTGHATKNQDMERSRSTGIAFLKGLQSLAIVTNVRVYGGPTRSTVAQWVLDTLQNEKKLTVSAEPLAIPRSDATLTVMLYSDAQTSDPDVPFHIELLLFQLVRLTRDPSVIGTVATWHIWDEGQGDIKNKLVELVNAFIEDYNTAQLPPPDLSTSPSQSSR
jgi:hypothetical protein